MIQKYIIGDVAVYDNKVMVVKELRDASHYDLLLSKARLVYCLVDINEIKPVRLTSTILEKNGWEKDDRGYNKSYIFLNKERFGGWAIGIGEEFIKTISFVHELQHLLYGLGINHEMEV